jgi:hypothetical protein
VDLELLLIQVQLLTEALHPILLQLMDPLLIPLLLQQLIQPLDLLHQQLLVMTNANPSLLNHLVMLTLNANGLTFQPTILSHFQPRILHSSLPISATH